MKYFVITKKIHLKDWDGREPMVIYGKSHGFTQFKSGASLIDYTKNEKGEPFQGPLICVLDDEYQTGEFPPFFLSPAFIANKEFVEVLKSFGLQNIEFFPVIIKDQENDRDINDYTLVNILGCVSCAKLDNSESEVNDQNEADSAIQKTDKLVIDEEKVHGNDIFRVREDANKIVMSESLVKAIKDAGFDRVIFDEVLIS